MVDLTLQFHISSGGRDDFATLNRNVLEANLIQIAKLGQLLFHRNVII